VALGREALLNSKAAWNLMLRMYERQCPHVSLLEYFWTWRTLLDRTYEDTIFRACAPSPASPLTVECFPAGGLFRDLKFDFWIGYDF